MNLILQKHNNHPKTILLNPLLNLDQVINKEIIKYIQKIDAFINCLLIISDNDEVLNHDQINTKLIESNLLIISKNDNHQLIKFKNYFDEIDRYIDSTISI